MQPSGVLATLPARVALALGLLVLAGWVLAPSVLLRLAGAQVPTKPVTAVGLVVLGLVLGELVTSRAVRQALAGAVAVVATETLVTIVLGVDSLTSTLLMPEGWRAVTPDGSGRMALGTALALLALAAALLVTPRRRVSSALAGVAFLLAYVAMLGHLYGVAGLHSLQTATAMAPATALGLVLLALSAALRRGMPLHRLLCDGGTASSWSRQLLPWTVLAPPVVGWLDLAGREAGWFGHRYGIALVVLAFSFTTSVAVLGGIRTASRIDAARERALDELEQLNAVLSERVATAVAEAEEGRDRLRVLLERTPVGIFETGPDGTRRFTNQRWRQIAGLGATEVEGATWSDVVHPEDREWVVRDWRAAVAAGNEWSARYRYLRHDGSVTWVDTVAVAVRNSEGEVQRWLGSVTDVTEQVRADERLAESEQRYRSVVTSMAEGVLLQDREGGVLTANDAASRLLGTTREELVGVLSRLRAWDAVHEDGSPFLEEERPSQRALRAGTAVRDVTMGVRRADGSQVWLSVNAEPLYADGEVTGVVTTFADVTAARLATVALRRSEQQFRTAMEHAPIGMALLELDGRVREVNRALCRLVGYGEDELVGLPLHRLVHPEDRVADERDLAALLDGTLDHHTSERRYLSSTGEALWVMEALSYARGEHDDDAYLVAQIQDVTASRAATERLAHRALHDPLTGLPNRDLLMDHLAHALARNARSHDATAVMFCDLDGFKAVNDTYGHESGDRLLVELAARLKAVVRPGDTVARLGGDEFVVVAEGLTDGPAVRALAERVREALGQPVDIGEATLCASGSVGVAIAEPGDDARAVLRAADAAMYRAKARGRDRVELSTSGSPLAPVVTADRG